MGILAAFTVPSLFNTPSSTANSKYTAVARDTAFMVLSAYEQYRAANSTIPTTMSIADLTPYMNYVKIDTASTIDGMQTQTSESCATYRCLVLHNGGIMRYSEMCTMGTPNEKAACWFDLDPDGKYSGTTNGPGKMMQFWLYYDGKIRTWATMEPNTRFIWYGVTNNMNPDSSYVPPWFSGF